MKKVIAIDLGATHLRVAVVNEKGKVATKNRESLNKSGESNKAISKQMINQIAPLIEEYDPQAITIGSIGPLDLKKGAIVNTPNVKFNLIPIKEPLESEFNLSVKLFNDCQAAVWGEATYGAGKDLQNVVYITISTGIGGGAVVDNHLLKGVNNNAVEIGHQIVEEKYDFKCSCGKGKGHWEGIASGENLPRFFKAWLDKNNLEVDFDPTDSKAILGQAENNETVKSFVKELGKINARAISNIIVAYSPALITIGGAVTLNHPKIILDPIKDNIDHFLKEPKIKITPLGEEITLIGATASHFYPPQ